MASSSLPSSINPKVAKDVLINLNEELCDRLTFDQIKVAVVATRIIGHGDLDMFESKIGNKNKVLEFLRELKKTSLKTTFAIFYERIIPESSVGDTCREMILEEYNDLIAAKGKNGNYEKY